MQNSVRRNKSGPSGVRGQLALLCGLWFAGTAMCSPYTPASDDEVLAVVPAGAAHTTIAARRQATARLDVALPLAQFYLSQARATGDLRFLGYADAILTPWRSRSPPIAAVLVMDATILQSRHAFAGALAELDRALQLSPQDPQAWLTRATVLRVLGRYSEASESCTHLEAADTAMAELCAQSIQALTGRLADAYRVVQEIPRESLAGGAMAWRFSELGEMAVSLGAQRAAEEWFQRALQLTPDDSYTRAAYADLLIDQGRYAETLRLLQGHESMEPLLLRIAIAQQRLHDRQAGASRALLASAFEVEEQRGESVHRREQARFLLDVVDDADGALLAAERNWGVQREIADALILLQAARAAHRPEAAIAARDFVRAHRIEDIRLQPYLEANG